MSLNRRITYLQNVSSGISCAKNLNIAICALARDCAQNAKKNIKTFVRLKKHFANLKLYILENDSKDNTRKVLAHYAKKYNYISLYSLEDYSQRQQAKTRDLLRFLVGGKASMQRMSLLRDLILKKALADLQFSAEVFVQIDIDIASFNTNGFLHSFASYDAWDCVVANGRSVLFDRFSTSYNYFHDTYALLPYHQEKKRIHNADIHLQPAYASLTKFMPLYPIKSAFGGMGIYKKNVAHALTYYESAKKDEFSFCEHVSVFKQLRKKEYEKIYINPAMLVYYGSRIRAFLSAVNIGYTCYKSRPLLFLIKTLHFFPPIIIFIYLRNFVKKFLKNKLKKV